MPQDMRSATLLSLEQQIREAEQRLTDEAVRSYWRTPAPAPTQPPPPAPRHPWLFDPHAWDLFTGEPSPSPAPAPAPTPAPEPSRAGAMFDEFRELFASPATWTPLSEREEPETMPSDTARAYIPRAVRNDWRTPDPVLVTVSEALGGAIQLDPCASTEHWLAGGDEIGEALNFHEEDDGLAIDWHAKLLAELPLGATPTVYVNPPFNQNAKWMAKCAEEAAKGLEIIALIPARVDTRYWHNHCAKATAVAFWRGRIKFVGADNSAPFPVALIYWGPNVARFEAVLEAAGHHVP